MIIIFSAVLLYCILLGTIKIINAIPWFYISIGVLWLVGLLVGCYLVYSGIKYILNPLYLNVVIPLCNFIWNKSIVPFFKFIWNKLLVPLYKYILTPLVKYSIVKPVEYTVVKPTKYCGNKIASIDCSDQVESVFNGIVTGSKFIRFIISWPFIVLFKGFIYAFEFFIMCKDLIHSMYKKNCPRITWVENEENKINN